MASGRAAAWLLSLGFGRFNFVCVHWRSLTGNISVGDEYWLQPLSNFVQSLSLIVPFKSHVQANTKDSKKKKAMFLKMKFWNPSWGNTFFSSKMFDKIFHNPPSLNPPAPRAMNDVFINHFPHCWHSFTPNRFSSYCMHYYTCCQGGSKIATWAKGATLTV